MALPRISRILSTFNPSTRCWAPIPPRLPTSNNIIQNVSAAQNVIGTPYTKMTTLSLTTWNINAFSPRPIARVSAIIDHLLKSSVSDAIFLQEVNSEVHAHLLRDTRIRANFFITDAEDKTISSSAPFTTMTLLSKACFASCTTEGKAILGPVTRVQFPSHYGRDALCTDVFLPPFSFNDSWRRLRLINLHLDSLSSTLQYRKLQMAIVANLLHENKNQQEDGQCCLGIAAGDFNAISPEDQKLIAKNDLVDAWVKLHSKGTAEHKGLTWGDAERRRLDGIQPGRLDRVAMTEGLEPVEMQILRPGTILIPKPGKERNGEVQWSDHAGLRCTFRVPLHPNHPER